MERLSVLAVRSLTGLVLLIDNLVSYNRASRETPESE